jgi:hypothetical protein
MRTMMHLDKIILNLFVQSLLGLRHVRRRFMSKVLSIVWCVLALGLMAAAVDNLARFQDVGQVTFTAPVRVGTTLLQPGLYRVGQTVDGANHILIFQAVSGKGPGVRVKCELVELGKKAEQTRTVYALNAANERVLQELVLKGDTAKHVF